MIELDPGLAPACVPLSWLLGRWEGVGVGEHPDGGGSYRFGQELVVGHDGREFLSYDSTTWLLDDDGRATSPGPRETGWLRPVAAGADRAAAADGTPGADGAGGADGADGAAGADAADAAADAADAHDTDLLLAHPDGIVELYLGRLRGPRLELATDAVVRTPGAPGRAAAQRLYGLVESDLLWAWDAGPGPELSSVMSARLRRVGPAPVATPPAGVLDGPAGDAPADDGGAA